MKWLKNFDRLLEIQRNIVWPSVLELDPKQYFPEFLKAALSRQPCERLIVSPRRQILMEGPLFLLDSSKPTDMYLILFDDLLIITRRKKSLSKKVRMATFTWILRRSAGTIFLKIVIRITVRDWFSLSFYFTPHYWPTLLFIFIAFFKHETLELTVGRRILWRTRVIHF